MPHNSITRLRLRSFLNLPGFFLASGASAKQAASAPGFIEGALLAEGRMVFWTRTVWENADAMKAFRSAGAHGAAMPKLIDWCDEASVMHWEGEPERDWNAIYARMVRDGRSSRVRHPTPTHQERRYAPIKPWGGEQRIG